MSLVLSRKLVRDLRSRALAVGALASLVAVGIGCYVGCACLYRDLTVARDEYYRAQRLADLLVEVEHAPRRSLARLARLPGVLAIRDRVAQPVLLDLPAVTDPVTGLALSMPHDHAPALHDAYLTAGGWFSGAEAREVVVNHQFAAAHGIRPGARLRLTLRGERLDLLVVGTAMDPQFVWILPPGGGLAPDPARFAVLYLPRRLLARQGRFEGAFNQVLLKLRDPRPAVADATLARLEQLLEPYGVTSTSRMAENASVKMLDEEIRGLRVTIVIMPLIFLGVAGLILHVVMERLVAQQRTVIGTLRALGYSRWRLVRHYVAFALVVGLLGGLLGLGIGRAMEAASMGVYAQMFAMPGIEPRPALDVYLVGLLVAALIAALGAARAVWRVDRLEPAESMRPPPPEAGHRILPERWPALWDGLAFRTKLVLRSLFRNPLRNAVVVLATFAGTAITLCMVSMMDSVDVMMGFHFERISHEDVGASLRKPRGPEVVRELGRIAGVRFAEGQLAIPADLSHGSRTRRMGVLGLPAGHRLYTPVDPEGRPIPIPASGLVLDRMLAARLGVGPGDVIDLRPLIGRRERTRARVTHVIETYLGLSAYADAGYLSRLLGEGEVYNQVLLALDPGASRPQVMRALKDRPDVTGLSERRRNIDHVKESFGDIQLVSLGIMVFFAGLIAFASVLNTALVTLSERRQEVATLRVLGYHPGTVAGLFARESLVLNGLGVGLGLGGGVGLTHMLAWAYDTDLYRIPALTPPLRVLQTCLLMVIFVGLAQRFVDRSVGRVDCQEALSVKE